MSIDDDVDDAMDYIAGLESAETNTTPTEHTIEFYGQLAEQCQSVADALKDDIERNKKEKK